MEKASKPTENIRKSGLSTIISAVKSSNDLPSAGSNWAFYSSFPAFQTLMNAQASKLLMMMQRCINHQQVKGSVLESVGYREVSDRFECLVEINDQLLERIQGQLDEAAGIKPPGVELCMTSEPPRKFGRFTMRGGADAKAEDGSKPAAATSTAPLKRPQPGDRSVTRPQLRFTRKPDNSPLPFRPRLTSKPHACVPLNESLLIAAEEASFPHPYFAELDALTFPKALRNPPKGVKTAPPLENTPLTMVRTKAALKELVSVLSTQKEIAVDLEHHAYRTYLGVTCLMQISTWTQDYIVDTLELWDHLERLNVVFADPGILKVFHGAQSDILWLQRDLGLYVVNMYDTGIGARYLGHSRLGLGALLESFCGVTTDKAFQLADWRQRPLSEAMITYARKDTHYLLEIFSKQRANFLANDRAEMLEAVWNESRQLCLSRYEKPEVSDANYLELYRNVRKKFSGQQLAALKSLVKWRDEVARSEDESHAYVLPNHMLVMICDTLPREHTGVFACCNPIPTLVRKFILDIHKLVLEARDSCLEAPSLDVATAPTAVEVNTDDPVRAQHDLSHTESRAAPEPLPTNEERALLFSLLKSDSPALRLQSSRGAGGGAVQRTSLRDPLREYLLTTMDFALKAFQKDLGRPASTANGSPAVEEGAEEEQKEEEDSEFCLDRPVKKKVRLEPKSDRKSQDEKRTQDEGRGEEGEEGEEEEGGGGGGAETMTEDKSSFEPFDYTSAELPKSSEIGRMRDRMLDQDSKKPKSTPKKKKGQKGMKKKLKN